VTTFLCDRPAVRGGTTRKVSGRMAMAGGVDRTGAVLRQLLSPAALADPYPVYERLRLQRAEGHDIGRLVLDHDPAVRLLGDRSWSSDRVTTTLSALAPDDRRDLDPLERMLRAIVAFQDPPDHTRVRRLLHRSFTPKVVRRQRDVVVATTRRLVEAFATSTSREGDLVSQVLFPLPAAVVAGILGVPQCDVPRFESAAQYLVRWFGAGRPSADLARRTRAALVEARAVVAELVVRRRARPGDDLLSAMVEAADDVVEADGPPHLTEEEVAANAIFLMTAGHETAANALANAIVALLARPTELDRIRHEQVLPDTAVDELLRFDSPVQLTARLATADRELDGRVLRRGDSVMAVLGAANRDPTRFDAPGELRLDRTGNHPLSFGHGAHHCLGAALAREELRIVVPEVVRHFPRLSLRGPLTYQATLDFRGPTALPVRW
jgi:cytochrome P450